MAINLLPENNDNDRIKQNFINPSKRTGRNAQPNTGAEFRNPLHILKGGLNKMDQLAGINKKPSRFAQGSLQSSSIAGTGNPMQFGDQINAQKILQLPQQPIQQPTQQPPAMGNNPMQPVNLAETATQQPGYVSPDEVAALRSDTALPTTSDTALPTTSENVLPVNDFNQGNTQDYFKQAGYMKDDDPQMVKRRKEAEEVQRKRMEYINNSATGMYDLGGNRNGRQSLGAKRLAFDKSKFTKEQLAGGKTNELDRQQSMQELSNKSTQFDAKLINQLGQKMSDPAFGEFRNRIRNAKDDQQRKELLSEFENWSNGIPMDVFDDFIGKETQRDNELGLPMLAPK